jgi:hypothetical protein
MDENLESLANLEENLHEYGMDINSVPLVIQYNKRDLPDVYTVEELQQKVNRFNAPYFEAVAVTGEGVFPTLKKLSQMVLESLNRQQASSFVRTPRKATEPAKEEAPSRAAARVKVPQPVAVGATAGSGPSVRSRGEAAGAAGTPSMPSTGSFAQRQGPASTPRGPTRVVRETVTESPGVRQIERKTPNVEPVVRKRPTASRPQPPAPEESKSGKKSLVLVAVVIGVLAAAAAAVLLSGAVKF